MYDAIFYVAALVCFLLAALGADGTVIKNFVALGYACLVASLIF